MDGSKKNVGKWTRFQRKKADEELLQKVKKMLKHKRRSKNKAISSDVEILSENWGDNVGEEEEEEAYNSSSSIEIIDEKYIPPEKRRKSSATKIRRDETTKVDGGVYCGEESSDPPKNNRSNVLFFDISDNDEYEGDGFKSGSKCDKEGEENQIQEIDMDSDDSYSIMSSFDSSSEDDDHESDEDYNQDESCNSEDESRNSVSDSESDDSSHCSEEEEEEEEQIRGSNASKVERSPGMENRETEKFHLQKERKHSADIEDDKKERWKRKSQQKPREKYTNFDSGKVYSDSEEEEENAAKVKRNPVGGNSEAGKFHLQKERKHSADIDDVVSDVKWKRKSQPELREEKTELDLGKVFCDNDGNADELDGASEGYGHVSQENRGSRGVWKEFNSKKHPSTSRDVDLMNILSHSIWEEGERDTLKEMLHPLQESDSHNDHHSLPLKFRFGDEEEDPDPTQAEKDEEQKELASLFAGLEMGLIQEDIGTTKLPKEDEDEDAKMCNPAENCQLGHHILILDETIGLFCKYCGIVVQEMKYILPDLKLRTKKRSEWYALYGDKSSLSDQFQFEHSATGDHDAFSIDTEGSVLNIIPAYLRRQMYPHQLEGFEFLWKNIAGATMVEDLKESIPKGGSGCIISHAPGTGKSFLTIVFLFTFMEVHPTCRPLIIAPLTMLSAWESELKRWKVDIPFHNLNDSDFSGKENVMAASMIHHVGNSGPVGKKMDRDYKRMVKLYSWIKDKKSILGIGYNLFEKLTAHNRGTGAGNDDNSNNVAEAFRKILLKLPGVLVLDEGHRPRNRKSRSWKTLTQVETGRRIILSGTPFQNNFDELYNTFYLANPKFVESIYPEAYKSDTARKRKNQPKGRWDLLTGLIDKNDDVDDAVPKLRSMMDPFVHVHKGNMLQESLPGIKDALVLLNPTDIQQQMLQKIPRRASYNLDEDYLAYLVSVHPSLVSHRCEFSDDRIMLEDLKSSIEDGVKTQFVIEMVRLIHAQNEKVLIFSLNIAPLDFLMKQLSSCFRFKQGKEILYIYGKVEDKERQQMINLFNDQNSDARVLLASTKACNEGINLVGASRVILLDVAWNHSVNQQAISRAYRLGQKKFVYIYRLIMGEMEMKKFQRQAKKHQISELVFSSSAVEEKKSGRKNENCKFDGKLSGDDILDAMVHHENLSHIFEDIRTL